MTYQIDRRNIYYIILKREKREIKDKSFSLFQYMESKDKNTVGMLR